MRRPIFILLAALIAILAGCDKQPADTVLGVQRQANSQVRYEAEAPGRDVWKVPGKSGDCEDYCLLKRVQLIRLGYDQADLRVIMVNIPNNGKIEGHAILYIISEDLVLDNNEGGLLSLAEWIARYKPTYACVAGDISEGEIVPAQKRCEGPISSL